MPTKIDLFDYDLPPDRIAQTPASPRDACKLMILDRATGEVEHRIFRDIVDELRVGDVLVMNDTKVFKARLAERRGIEIFLLRGDGRIWETLMKPGKKVLVGDKIEIGELNGTVIEKREDGVVIVEFDRERDEVIAFANAHGDVPLPPYIAAGSSEDADYQTVYARETGSVAAPTAGLHFTPELLDAVRATGVEIVFVTLHVGLGTFRPVKSNTLEEHEMHAEYVEISAETSDAIKRAKSESRRVIAVGTTTVRALESIGAEPYTGDVNVFITPGYKFNVIDALITNFHLPKSTLLVLVSAFAGRDHVLAAYRDAIVNDYRFFSFGDAMFIR